MAQQQPATDLVDIDALAQKYGMKELRGSGKPQRLPFSMVDPQTGYRLQFDTQEQMAAFKDTMRIKAPDAAPIQYAATPDRPFDPKAPVTPDAPTRWDAAEPPPPIVIKDPQTGIPMKFATEAGAANYRKQVGLPPESDLDKLIRKLGMTEIVRGAATPAAKPDAGSVNIVGLEPGPITRTK